MDVEGSGADKVDVDGWGSGDDIDRGGLGGGRLLLLLGGSRFTPASATQSEYSELESELELLLESRSASSTSVEDGASSTGAVAPDDSLVLSVPS